jgi:hypothetical protein
MAGLKGKSGPPGNMNAFKHGLAAIQKRREESIITEHEQSIRAVATLCLNGRLLWVPKELMITAETMSVGSDQIGYPPFSSLQHRVHLEIPPYSIAILRVLLAIMLS